MSLDDITGPPESPRQEARRRFTDPYRSRRSSVSAILLAQESRPEAVMVSVTSKGCSGHEL